MADRRSIAAGAALKAACFAISLPWPAAALADPVDRWASAIAQASGRQSIPESWIRRVMRIESGGKTMLHGKPTVSRAGAIGLMQLMPGTWRDMRALLGLGPDPQDPSDNILAGTAYLRLMYDRFGYPGLFAAYNAGPARYAAFLSGRRGLPAETRSYFAAVAPAERKGRAIASRSPPGIFVVTATSSAAAGAQPPQRASQGLFVALNRLRR